MEADDYEELLGIKTCGVQREYYDSIHYNGYEPTAYFALETLCNGYSLSSKDNIVDFGCGKGRLNFFINHFYGCNVTGVEMNTVFYEECLDNKSSYIKTHNKCEDKVQFINCLAQDYEIKQEDNKFYFFNPFSQHIFINIIDNILDSIEKFNRPVDIILYYPTYEYLDYLENNTSFKFITDITLPGLHEYDSREKFSIYRLDCNIAE